MPNPLRSHRATAASSWGQEKCAEAQVPILGGHTVEDLEPKYGLAVIGAHGGRVVRVS